MRFNCPHCDGAIEMNVKGVDKGLDALGFPADEVFVPKSTDGMKKVPDKKLWRPAFIVPRVSTIIHPDGNTYKTKRQEVMPSYYEGDNSWSDLFRKQFPSVKCGEVT